MKTDFIFAQNMTNTFTIMRKRSFTLSVLLLLLVYSCSESVVQETTNETKGKEKTSATTLVEAVDVPYTFDALASQEAWMSFQNLEERQAACQVKGELLTAMSTENLVQTCMNYPMRGMYSAYNNELDGIQIIMDGFDGFQELKAREDAAEKLISYYANMEVGANTPILLLGYIELILASKCIPSLYDAEHITSLANAMHDKLEVKLRYPTVYSMFSIKRSLLLGAQIALTPSINSPANHVLLAQFVQSGGMVNSPEIYTQVSQIITNN
jgi:hypothetical protein